MTVTEPTPASSPRPPSMLSPTGASGDESYEPTAAWLRRQWRRWRTLIAVAVLVIVLGVGYGLATMGTSATRLDPSSGRPDGTRALATLLQQRGVQVERTDGFEEMLGTLDQDVPATVLLTRTENLDRERAERLRATARNANAGLVLAEPSDGPALRLLAPGVHPAGNGLTTVLPAGCDWPGAELAGKVRMPDPLLYRASGAEWRTCYSDGTRDALVFSERIAVLGAAGALTNEELGQQGNAALGLNLLGARDRLIVYLPSGSDVPGDQPPSLTALLPPQVIALVGVLGVVVVLAALTAARRLGPVVAEPLPVRVPAAETTLGHARLYRRAHAHGHAAEALRGAARRRIAHRLGLPATETSTEASTESGTGTGTSSAALVVAVADRTGRTESAVAEILAGGAPSDDNGLVELADALDRLEQEVSRS